MTTIRTHYLDASAIVKLLVNEEGSERLHSYCEEHTNFRTTALCVGEAVGVLKVKHFRRKEIDQGNYFAASEILAGWTTTLGGLEIEEVNISDRSVFYDVEELCKKYSLDLSDGLQIYTLKKGFLSVLPGDSAPILITADDALADAVEREGGRVWHVLRDLEPKARQ
jgi:predicted nucleic acid-binding protein